MQKVNKYINVLIPIFSIIIGFLIGAIILVASGYNPIEGYTSLLTGAFGTPFYIGQTIRATTPLILIALGFTVAYKAGFFNIGLAGQTLCGWLSSVAVALAYPDLPQAILLPLCILVGMTCGALWAGIAGFLKAYFHTSEVVSTIMLNYIIVFINDYVIRNMLTNPPADATSRIGANASLRIPFLTALTKNSTIHSGIFIALLVAIVVYVLFQKTTVGLELKAVGFNAHAAEYAGMNTRKNIIVAMLISGALAGLAGVMEGLGHFQHVFQHSGVAPAVGFKGMSVALLGGGNPLGIVLAALLFGVFEAGTPYMATFAHIPNEIVDIIIAIIIFFVGAGYVIRLGLTKVLIRKPKTQKEGE